MVQMLFTLPRDMKQALDEVSKSTGIPRARLIREGLQLILRRYLKQKTPTT